jgi:hypothetical protein
MADEFCQQHHSSSHSRWKYIIMQIKRIATFFQPISDVSTLFCIISSALHK